MKTLLLVVWKTDFLFDAFLAIPVGTYMTVQVPVSEAGSAYCINQQVPKDVFFIFFSEEP